MAQSKIEQGKWAKEFLSVLIDCNPIETLFSPVNTNRFFDCSIIDDEIVGVGPCRCLPCRYRCIVNDEEMIVVSANTTVKCERPVYRIPLEKNIDLK